MLAQPEVKRDGLGKWVQRVSAKLENKVTLSPPHIQRTLGRPRLRTATALNCSANPTKTAVHMLSERYLSDSHTKPP